MKHNKILTPAEIEDYLFKMHYFNSGRRAITRLKDFVTVEDYEVIRAIAKLVARSRNRAAAPNRQWHCDLKEFELWKIWTSQNGKCAVTGMPLSTVPGNQSVKNPWAASIDRINPKLGYYYSNIRLVTHWYNNAKNNWLDEVCIEALNHWKNYSAAVLTEEKSTDLEES